MSAKVLTKAAAKEAKIELIDGGRGTQAVHDVVVAMRAARRSGTANTKTKADVNLVRRQTVAAKGTGRARAGYKSSVDLARRRCRLWTKAARLFQESFKSVRASRFRRR